MRILAVGNLYPPHHLGGYELAWRSAMRHLRERGHVARVLTTDFQIETAEPDEPDTFRELRWYWHDYAWPRIGWRERIALERHNADVLERHLQELAPDVVTWWSMGGMSLALIERVRRAGLPAVAFVHDDWLLYGPLMDRWTAPFTRRPRWAALAERLTALPAHVDLDNAARYVFVSAAIRDRAFADRLHHARASIAHSGIDPTYLDPRPERPWGWRLLYVGRIDERKGVREAVAALADLPSEATLTIVGDGDRQEVAACGAQAHALGLSERVVLTGSRSRHELPALYDAADVVLFPVRWQEPWGLVPLEAMALGRPVVATGLGGSGEYLRDGENSLIVPPGQPAAIAAAVRRLEGDPGLRERLRADGLRTARRHTEPAFNEAVLAEVTAVRRG